MSSTVDLDFILIQVRNLMDETRLVRKEVGEIRTLTLQTFEFARRVERRQAELRDDLEITIKMELGGTLANFQTSLDTVLQRLEAKIDRLDERRLEGGSGPQRSG